MDIANLTWRIKYILFHFSSLMWYGKKFNNSTKNTFNLKAGTTALLSHFRNGKVPVGLVAPANDKSLTSFKDRLTDSEFSKKYLNFVYYHDGPSSKLFKDAFKKLKKKMSSIKPEQVLHVGQLPETEYETAKKSGACSVFIHGKDTVKNSSLGIPSPQVFNDLTDLFQCITERGRIEKGSLHIDSDKVGVPWKKRVSGILKNATTKEKKKYKTFFEALETAKNSIERQEALNSVKSKQ